MPLFSMYSAQFFLSSLLQRFRLDKCRESSVTLRPHEAPPNPRLAPSPNLLTQTSILYYFWLTTSFSKSFPCKAFQIYLPLLILCQLSDSDVQRAQDLSD